ncbi:MAG: hypothetical protein RLZZ301_177 [Bacteroidota bacterium]|jgi:hypothetical protein
MRYLFLVFLSCLLFSCKSIEALPPAIDENESLPELPLSSIRIPTTMAMGPYLNTAEKSVPEKFSGKEENCEGVSYQYHFERQPIRFSFENRVINYEVLGRFDLSLSYCPSCHHLWDENGSCSIPRVYASCGVNEPKRNVRVAYETQVDLGASFELKSKTKLTYFHIEDPCEITVFRYNATATVEKEVQAELKKLERQIDQELYNAPVKSSVEEVWNLLQEPIAIAPYGFLYMKPQQLSLQELTFNQQTKKLQVQTELSAQPLFSTNPLTLARLPLGKNTDLTIPDGLHLHLLAFASYDSLESLINREMGIQTFPVKNKSIQLDRIHFIGCQDGKMVLGIDFSGSKKGRFYLFATPYVDSSQALRLKDVTYDLESKSLLLKSAKWMFSSKIIAYIERAFVYDLRGYITESQHAITESLNTELSNGVFLSGAVDQLSLSDLILRKSGVYIQVDIDGWVKLKID